jgi:hypothetical protein
MKFKLPRLSAFAASLVLITAMSPSIAMAAKCSSFQVGQVHITPKQYIPELNAYLAAKMSIVTQVDKTKGRVHYKYYEQVGVASWKFLFGASYPCTR